MSQRSNSCPECTLPFAYCDCEGTSTTVAVPYCPKCGQDRTVFCLECSYDVMGCDCVGESDDWYCQRCDHEFRFDVTDISESWDDEEPELEFELEPVFDRPEPTKPGRGSWQDADNLKWWWDDGTEAKCYCYTPKLLLCYACEVSRPTSGSNWNAWIDIEVERKVQEASAKASAAKAATATAGSYSGGYSKYTGGNGNSSWDYGWDGWDVGYKGGFAGCGHKMFPVKFNEVTVYASSLSSKDNREDEIPDFGLYADWMWNPWWRNEHIDWADYGLPSHYETAAQQIIDAFEFAKQGKKIDIGCIGGHGRTGTILCCMAVLDGFTPKEALTHVSSTYCTKVVETWDQEWWITWFACFVDGTEAPPKPPKPEPKVITPTTPTGTTVTGTLATTPFVTQPIKSTYGAGKAVGTLPAPAAPTLTCPTSHHYTALKAGATVCGKQKECKTWARDLERYLKGWDKGYTYETAAEIADRIRAQAKTETHILPTPTPILGQLKDGFVYTTEGWVPDQYPEHPAVAEFRASDLILSDEDLGTKKSKRRDRKRGK